MEIHIPMKKRFRWSYTAAAVLPLLFLAGSSLVGPRPVHAQAAPVVEITAKRFGFSPDHITLKKGQQVTLRLTSQDVTHGFFSRPLHLDGTISPEKPTELTITPDTAGTFTTICDHFCGTGHGNMKMTITVE